jgi:transposase
VDLRCIDGVDVLAAQTPVSEAELDMSRWKTGAPFAWWLGLCPDSRIRGDKVLSSGYTSCGQRAATALRLGAATLLRSQAYLALRTAACAASSVLSKAITTGSPD